VRSSSCSRELAACHEVWGENGRRRRHLKEPSPVGEQIKREKKKIDLRSLLGGPKVSLRNVSKNGVRDLNTQQRRGKKKRGKKWPQLVTAEVSKSGGTCDEKRGRDPCAWKQRQRYRVRNLLQYETKNTKKRAEKRKRCDEKQGEKKILGAREGSIPGKGPLLSREEGILIESPKRR